MNKPVFLHVFDLDHTLVRCNSSFHFGKFLYQQGYISLSSTLFSIANYSSHIFFNTSLSLLHEKIFKTLFIHKDVTLLQKLAKSFTEKWLNNMLYPPALQRLTEAKALNHTILILSSSPDFLVAPIAQHLKIKHWKSTQYEINHEGNFSHVSLVMDAKNKVREFHKSCNRLSIPLSSTIAYSDSHLDIPLLKEAGKAVAVNPNKRLTLASKKFKWEIL